MTSVGAESPGEPAPLSPELAAALEELPSRPGGDLLQLLRADGLLAPAALLTALLLAAGGLVVEALLFRSFFDLGRELGLAGQRLGAMGVLLGFVAALLLLESPLQRACCASDGTSRRACAWRSWPRSPASMIATSGAA